MKTVAVKPPAEREPPSLRPLNTTHAEDRIGTGYYLNEQFDPNLQHLLNWVRQLNVIKGQQRSDAELKRIRGL